MIRNPFRPLIKRMFNFQRFGSSFHLTINSSEDLIKLLELDEAHWVATNAPINTINTDPVFLTLLDNDEDTRIRAAEVKEAVSWTLSVLRDHRGIDTASDILDVAAVDAENEDGQTIIETANKILSRLRSNKQSSITLTQIREIKRKEQQGGLDKAGVVLAGAADTEDEEQFIRDILKTIGGETHPGGKSGINFDGLQQFLNEATELEEWRKKADISPGKTSDIMPLGEQTFKAYRIFRELHEKIEQFYALCDLIRLNPSAEQFVYSDDRELNALDVHDFSAIKQHVQRAAVSPPNDAAKLNFKARHNPQFSEQLDAFAKEVLKPLLGARRSTMDKDDWQKIKETFVGYGDWETACPDTKLHNLERSVIQKYLTDEELTKSLKLLIQQSHRTAFVLDNICKVEKLLLYQKYLLQFVNSFVSFPQLYDPKARALFEMGTLIMDGRHFTLCVKAIDRKQHVAYSRQSNMFVLYAEITTGTGEKLYEVAAPVTTGNRGNLQPNKWGIFQDLDGIERHARIVEIVENPISLTEAVIAPFKRLGRAITAKLEDITQKAQKTLEEDGSSALVQAKTNSGETAKGDTSAGLLAGGGIAVAALGSSVAFITKTLASLSWLELVGSLLILLAAVIVPATLVAFLKLRSRDLSSILEGSGWGINARMRLTRKQAGTFTHFPPYPINSSGLGHKSWWILPLILIVVATFIWWRFL